MKALDIFMEYSEYLIFMIILLVTVFSVTKVESEKSRIEVCKNSGLEYYKNADICTTCDALGGKYNKYDQCVIRENGQTVTESDMKTIDPGYGVGIYG